MWPLCAKVVAPLLGFAFVAIVSSALYQLFTADPGMIIQRLNDEPVRLASTLFFEKMTALAQLTIALLGGTWALLTLAKTKVEVKDWPTIMCFILANLSFISSLLVYNCGYDLIVTTVYHHSSFDIDAPFVTSVNWSQQLFFVKGCFDLVATIFFGRQSQ